MHFPFVVARSRSHGRPTTSFLTSYDTKVQIRCPGRRKKHANLHNPINVHTHRDRADPEREDVGERSDGDGDAGVLHRQPDPLRDRRDGLLLFRQVVEALLFG